MSASRAVRRALASWGSALALGAIGSGCASTAPPAADRFVGRVALGGGFECVVAEGDLEPRSIGTFTVRVYQNLGVGDYVVGTIAPRDGFVRTAYRTRTLEGGPDRIVVEVETAGSGRYVVRHAFAFDPVARTLTRQPAD